LNKEHKVRISFLCGNKKEHAVYLLSYFALNSVMKYKAVVAAYWFNYQWM